MSKPGYPRLSAVPGLVDAVRTHGKASEAEVVAEIEAALKAGGYGKPPGGGPAGFYLLAGQRNARHSGSDSGVPDLIVAQRTRVLLFEVKRREVNTEIKPSQFAMWERGALHIVNTAEQVMEILAK